MHSYHYDLKSSVGIDSLLRDVFIFISGDCFRNLIFVLRSTSRRFLPSSWFVSSLCLY